MHASIRFPSNLATRELRHLTLHPISHPPNYLHRRNLQTLLAGRHPGLDHHQTLPPPFRNRAVTNSSSVRSPPRFGGVGRLWNPTNSTPRSPPPSASPSSQPGPRQPPRRPRRPSTPPPPPVPLGLPVIHVSPNPIDPLGIGAGDYPLLPLPSPRRSRPSASARNSLQIEGRASRDHRVSLPKPLQYSYDKNRAPGRPPPEESEAGPSKLPPTQASDHDYIGGSSPRARNHGVIKRGRAVSFGLVRPDKPADFHEGADKGKGKAVMSVENEPPARGFSGDLERGPDVLGGQRRGSRASIPASQISSDNSSIVGDADQQEAGDEWGPQHPCFPHLNPHVPMNSPEYTATRIIRIRRDWLLEGDLAPTFSNLYPEILDPAGVSEQEFRRIIDKLNSELVPIFSPYNWRNILDGILGLLTGWLWDDLGFTHAKTKLNKLEKWLENWNTEIEKTIGSEDGAIAPKIIPLRRTGYMSLDIQIPDPEIAPAASTPGASRSGPPDTSDQPNTGVLGSSPPAEPHS
ncbi:hypothetical protein DL766_010103 [Monosporascus sp. MC13-8B]|uniref:Ras modification protein ERF4 n=1 Tax=Monosporascus cannonballus TaxID=155416 RepID=A0ABY0HBZ5_9PEZI|nr:hypothetical protein DL762_003996 [Monosporascus cannonballus]RYO95110.1 hypothetical protein DL763_003808 [Monosporascus cannonballus]RYP10500.1 hypothetical protein DL766_010103 [Monosporascus sp. MC13-8B]